MSLTITMAAAGIILLGWGWWRLRTKYDTASDCEGHQVDVAITLTGFLAGLGLWGTAVFMFLSR